MSNIFNDLFIFEMANNHQGDVEHGLEIIREISKTKRKFNIKAAVKLQYRNLESIIHPDYLTRKDIKHIPRFLDTRLSADEYQRLVEAIKEEDLIAMCTPFDELSVQLCMDHGIDIIKVASCSANDWPLLTEVVSTNKPIIISTGAKTLSEIDQIYNFFTHRQANFALMHCVALYPSPLESFQMDFIKRLIKRYPNVTIGYSGHEDPNNFDIVKIAIAEGAKILERHVGKETDSIKLNSYSMNPIQAENWVKAAIEAKKICEVRSDSNKFVCQEEIDSILSLARGTYAKKGIKKGEPITADKVFFAMPCQERQMTSGQFYDGVIATRDYEVNSPIYEAKRQDNIRILRSVIHDTKGMLFEANIALGKDFEIELSHHYGMAHFRQFGAAIINIINREYCKKIIVVLPSQRHPVHYHKIKEETFQLLYGDLRVELEDKVIDILPGDILTVERNVKHAFSSKSGAIFEEISTTHIKNDSYYEDDKINRLDPIERKTIIKQW